MMPATNEHPTAPPATTGVPVLDHDAAWRSLAIIWPGQGDVEIGPVTETNHVMALVVAGVIRANPALRSHICDRLADLPPVAGARVLPLAALGVEMQMTMAHGVHPWADEQL